VPGAATGHHALLAGKRLPLVFDLDETLLQAVTLRSFDERVDSTARRAAAAQQEVSAGGGEAPAAARLALLTSDLARLLADRALLHEYAATDAVTLDGARLPALLEPSADDVAAPPRPVLRLPGCGVVLTRIDPARRDTSMLVRVRPGWDDLRSFLTGGDRRLRREASGGASCVAEGGGPPDAPRFDVFVCTLSEKGYAHEMWRLLDPEGRLIAPAARGARLVATPPDRLKTLRGALGGSPCAALALVVDDRPSIWEVQAQGNVLPLAPFLPYATADGSGEGATGGWPLAAVRSALEATRASYFHALHERLLPRLAATSSADDPAALPPPPDAPGALRPHLRAALARQADAPPDAPPMPAGDALRGADLAALLAAAAVPSPLQQLLASAAAVVPIALARALGASMTALLADAMAQEPNSGGTHGAGHGMGLGMGTSAAAALRPAMGTIASAGGVVEGPFQLLRAEADRRGGIIDWECRYDGFGDAKVWTAVPHLNGTELARAQGPSKRAAQDKAAAVALGKLRCDATGGSAAAPPAALGASASAPASTNGGVVPAVAAAAAALPAGAAARMANLPGAPGSEKALTAALAVPTLSVFWERLEAEAAASGPAGGAPLGEGPALEYRVVAGLDQGHSAVVVELWAGRPPRAVAKGAGPGRKEATQRCALAALRQEGFAVAADLPGTAAAQATALAAAAVGGQAAQQEAQQAAQAKRKADEEAHTAAAKRAGLMGEHL